MPRTRRSWHVWAHLGIAAATILIAVPACLWWRNSVFFVIGISLATQIYTALSAAEAADDKAVTDRLDRIEALLRKDGP